MKAWEDWPQVEGDERYWLDTVELGLLVADALLTEDEGGIIHRAKLAQMEAWLRMEA